MRVERNRKKVDVGGERPWGDARWAKGKLIEQEWWATKQARSHPRRRIEEEE